MEYKIKIEYDEENENLVVLAKETNEKKVRSLVLFIDHGQNEICTWTYDQCTKTIQFWET